MNISRRATGGIAAALLATVAMPAFAGGIERAPQSIGIIFEKGRVVELSFGGVNPEVTGVDILGFSTGDVSKGYGGAGIAYKQDFTDTLSGAILLDSPFGADIRYDSFADGGSPVLGGTEAVVDSINATGILRYQNNSGFGVHGGLRMSVAEGDVTLSGLAYGALSGYNVALDRDTAFGYLIGVSWEKPEIAARVSLTYNSSIKHEFDTTESGPLIDPDGPGPIPALPLLSGTSTTEVNTPRSWNLEFQTGVAPDTLVFGSIRWVKWSEFKLQPERFVAVTGSPEGLVSLDDTTTWTLGVGRKFTENWSGSASLTYEDGGSSLVSPLAPTNGRTGVTLAAIYTRDNLKITTGLNYTWLGDAEPETGTPDTARASMTDNHAVGFGVRMAYTF